MSVRQGFADAGTHRQEARLVILFCSKTLMKLPSPIVVSISANESSRHTPLSLRIVAISFRNWTSSYGEGSIFRQRSTYPGTVDLLAPSAALSPAFLPFFFFVLPDPDLIPAVSPRSQQSKSASASTSHKTPWPRSIAMTILLCAQICSTVRGQETLATIPDSIASSSSSTVTNRSSSSSSLASSCCP